VLFRNLSDLLCISVLNIQYTHSVFEFDQCMCVCETSLGGHFRALDQTCKDIFSCEDLFRVLGKSGSTAVFSVIGMHVSVSFRLVLGSEHCSCSVCSTEHVTTRKLDNLCVVRPHLGGGIFVPWTKRARTFFCEDFFRVLGKCTGMCLLESWQLYKNLYVCVCVRGDLSLCACKVTLNYLHIISCHNTVTENLRMNYKLYTV